jgi:hypothetical protein
MHPVTRKVGQFEVPKPGGVVVVGWTEPEGQRPDHRRYDRGLGALADPHPHAADIELDRCHGRGLLPVPSMRRCQLHHSRDEARPASSLASLRLRASRRQPNNCCGVSPCRRNHQHRCSRLQRLLNHPRLVMHRPTTTAAGTGDHLDAPDRPLRLKRRFKSRHKPIPILTPGSAPSHLATTIKRRPQNIAYAAPMPGTTTTIVAPQCSATRQSLR